MKGEIRELFQETTNMRTKEVNFVSDGLIHQTYDVETKQDSYILQLAEPKKEKALRRKVISFSKLEKSQVPVPEVITPIKTGEVKGEEKKFYIAEKISGSNPEKGLESDLAKKIGGLLAKVHETQKFEKPCWLDPEGNMFQHSDFEEGSRNNWILKKVREDAEVLRNNGFGEKADEIENFFQEHGEKLPKDFQAVMCHGDYSPDNILIQGKEITGILDFDYTYSGHRQRDLVKSANAFWLENIEIRKKLYEGYKKETEIGENFGQNEAIYRLETLQRIIASLFELEEDLTEEKLEEFHKKLGKSINHAENKVLD
jgi:fructosamine-3-kinase